MRVGIVFLLWRAFERENKQQHMPKWGQLLNVYCLQDITVCCGEEMEWIR